MASKMNPRSPRPLGSKEDTVIVTLWGEEKMRRLKLRRARGTTTLLRSNFPPELE
jgi:hypothetical protein